jgi:hypothetical protein
MAKDRAWDQITIRNNMEQSMKPQFGKFQTGFIDPLRQKIGEFQTNTIDPLKNKMWGMMEDPMKRGYDAATKKLMFGSQADALAGAKASALKNVSKMSAGTGAGNAMRNVMDVERQNATNLRGASRDVELADAEAKRNDFWQATQGYGNAAGLGMQNTGQLMDTGNIEMQNRGQEQNFWNSMEDASQKYSALQTQKNQNGFLGTLKRSLGGAIGGWLSRPA